MEPKNLSLFQRLNLSCSDIEELLDSYLDEEMSPVVKTRFEKHLCNCEECKCLVDDSLNIKQMAKNLYVQPIPEGISERLRASLKEKIGLNLQK
ncbi:MAG: zf-HC2 domain-containing protein, partial [Proteobacteria bacterium]|nr:zf-HC2 domain-containing protein [Pseudomonadota bacterium]